LAPATICKGSVIVSECGNPLIGLELSPGEGYSKENGPGPIALQPKPACKWRFSTLPVLTYEKYAALRVTENHHFRLALN
jgi:hypothetical protein